MHGCCLDSQNRFPVATESSFLSDSNEKSFILHIAQEYVDKIEKNIPEKNGSTFQDILQEGSGPLFELYCHKLRSAQNIYAMFFKQEVFQTEKEYRIVFKTAAESQIHYRIKEGFITPYIEVTAGSALPLRQITVAPKSHVDLAERDMAQSAGSPGYDVPVVLSRLKLRFWMNICFSAAGMYVKVHACVFTRMPLC